MKKNKLAKLIFIILPIFFISCSDDDDSQTEENFGGVEKVKFITEISNSFFPDEIETLSYTEDGLLLNFTGGEFLAGNYIYDDNERLVSKSRPISGEEFTYEYDNNGRITRENKLGTNDYIQLKFNSNKITATRFFEFGGGSAGGGNVIERKEHTLDGEGRIIMTKSIDKISTLFTPEEITEIEVPFFDYEKYEYDSKGNIVKVTRKEFDKPNEKIEVINYDDKINPFYIAFKKLYKETYYINNFFSLRLFKRTGLTPNNVTKRGVEISSYKYDEDNYPVSTTSEFTVEGVEAPERFFKY